MLIAIYDRGCIRRARRRGAKESLKVIGTRGRDSRARLSFGEICGNSRGRPEESNFIENFTAFHRRHFMGRTFFFLLSFSFLLFSFFLSENKRMEAAEVFRSRGFDAADKREPSRLSVKPNHVGLKFLHGVYSHGVFLFLFFFFFLFTEGVKSDVR